MKSKFKVLWKCDRCGCKAKKKYQDLEDLMVDAEDYNFYRGNRLVCVSCGKAYDAAMEVWDNKSARS